MAKLYISGGKAVTFYRCTLFFFFFIQTLISEVTEWIPLILSHNVRSGCNLIIHPQKLVDLYPHRKITQKPPKMGISESEFDIRWRITLQRNFSSAIAALV